MNKYTKIYNLIKKFDTIYIVRHIGPDPDAIASQTALKYSILETFPNKKVYALGTSVARFKYYGKLDRIDDYTQDALVITLDVPDIKRIDGLDVQKFKNTIKIDHHPVVDEYATIEFVDDKASSTCELLIEVINNTKLKYNKQVAENLFMGLVSDTNRFLIDYTTPKTFKLVADLIQKNKLNIKELYKKLYLKPMSEVRLQGYIASNFVVTKNKLAYIELDNSVIKEMGVDSSAASNMVNEFNNINEALVWMIIYYDESKAEFKGNIRSRGPIINEVAANYYGGGHKFASGVRPKTKEEIKHLIQDLDKLCKDYQE